MRPLLGFLLAGLVLGAPARGDLLADSKRVDQNHQFTLSASELDDLAVLHDGQGHYLVVAKPQSAFSFLYYGNSNTLHDVPLRFASTDNGQTHTWTMESPRLDLSTSFLESSMELSSWTLRCDARTTPLLIADDKLRAQLLQAQFMPVKWQRHPYLLSRDSRGVYYYVDDLVGDDQDMQLYVGRPGKMRLQKLDYVVSDSEGDLLFTRRGKLRIDGRFGQEKRKVTWIQGKKRTELLHLAEQADTRLIFGDLGVYDGVHLGNPCEDL